MNGADRTAAYALLRIAFGVNFLGHGLFRVLSGVSAFAATTAEHLGKSPLPHGLILGFGYVIPWIEVLLGLGLIAGLLTRWALILGAVFIMALTIGVTSNQQWDVAGQQLVYSLIFALLLFGLEWNGWSLDAVLLRRRVRRRTSPLQ